MAGQLLNVRLVLPVDDIDSSADWYEEVLGFETVYRNEPDDDDPPGSKANYAVLTRDGAEVHLILEEGEIEHAWMKSGTGYLFMTVDDVTEWFERVRAKGTQVRRPLRHEEWGAQTFQLTDPAGNLVTVASPRE